MVSLSTVEVDTVLVRTIVSYKIKKIHAVVGGS